MSESTPTVNIPTHLNVSVDAMPIDYIATIAAAVSVATLLGLIITLWFNHKMLKATSLQLEQIERTIQGNTYQSLMDQVTNINRIFLDSPSVRDLWDPIPYVGRSGDPIDDKQSWAIAIMMDFYENMYFQHEKGNVPDEIWDRWSRHIINVFKTPRVRAQWDAAKVVYYRPFRDFVDNALGNLS